VTLAVLIPAHNEATVIGETVRLARRGATPPPTVYVIADRCTDDTAAQAEAAGARVYARTTGAPGKGAALAWFLTAAAAELATVDGLVILDADSRLRPGALPALAAALARGACAAQAFVRPCPQEPSPASWLAAYNEWLAQALDDRCRARLGWSVPLRGTGMALRLPTLREVAPALRTRVEDVELTLLVLRRGGRIAFVPEAVVEDPKPPGLGRLAQQRARWLQGQAEVWRLYAGTIARLAWTTGPAGWSVLAALLLKPRTAVVAAKALLLLGLGPFGSWAPARLLARLVAATLLADAVYYLVGLAVVPAAWRRPVVAALIRAPLYGLVWGRALLGSLRAREPWLRARD
jgi:cellulose synthase/poly-beta-1,6-N-acetylglucosamine synthase-like glycosyltransferase